VLGEVGASQLGESCPVKVVGVDGSELKDEVDSILTLGGDWKPVSVSFGSVSLPSSIGSEAGLF
jgi:hypothetical protein